jgi:hypothetical protein
MKTESIPIIKGFKDIFIFKRDAKGTVICNKILIYFVLNLGEYVLKVKYPEGQGEDDVKMKVSEQVLKL